MLAVRVLGCSGSYAAPGGACTGYLMESVDTKVWLDAGPGTLANLQEHCTLAELDAVVITHAHPDHWLELPVVANALAWYEPRSRLPVYSNAHVRGHAFDLIGPEIDDPFDWRVISEVDEVDIGDQRWSFAQTEHYVPTLATRVDVGAHSIVFSADTGPGFSLRSMIDAHGPIGLALIESTFVDREGHPGALHLSAAEAAQMALEAEVGRLVLTHQAPLEDQAEHLRVASEIFTGPIELAEVGALYDATAS